MEELLFKRFCQQRHISAEDYETYEQWEEFEISMKDMIANLLTLPLREAAKYAAEDGWIWKHYRDLVVCVIDDLMV